jgi:GNAT superfamily N-acetyltransferase
MRGHERSHTVTLRDGAAMSLRPIAPEDKPLIIDLLERLGEDSRYRRFFTSLRALSPAMLAYFTEVDHTDREAIIAIDPRSRCALGVARYVRLSEDPEAAEVAIAVADGWHRRGVAHALLAQLSSSAQHEGILRFVALVQAKNRDAMELVEGIGDSSLQLAGPNVELVINLKPPEGWTATSFS